jgi:fructose-1,6-bisphosphatase
MLLLLLLLVFVCRVAACSATPSQGHAFIVYDAAAVAAACLCLQGGGVFCNPKSATAPAKLRLLYECAPVALVVEVGWV